MPSHLLKLTTATIVIAMTVTIAGTHGSASGLAIATMLAIGAFEVARTGPVVRLRSVRVGGQL